MTLVGALWTLPNSVLGVLFALLSGAFPRPVRGLLLAHGRGGLADRFLARRGFVAITLGRVVVSVVPLTPRLLAHESHHARQYEVLGPFFLPVYLWQHARRGYVENPLEREAERCAQCTPLT